MEIQEETHTYSAYLLIRSKDYLIYSTFQASMLHITCEFIKEFCRGYLCIKTYQDIQPTPLLHDSS